MPLDEFWHGDMRLLEVYQKAYLRHQSQVAWRQGYYNFIAHSLSLGNAFAEKGKKPKDYPEWQDPVAKLAKPKITQENIDEEFMKQQDLESAWLFGR